MGPCFETATRLARAIRGGRLNDFPGKTRTTRAMGVFGPLARSVDDLELTLRVIAGPDGREAEAPPVPLGKSVARSAKDLRIAVLESNPLVKVSADTAAVLQATVKLLTKAGAKVKRARPDGLDWQQGTPEKRRHSTLTFAFSMIGRHLSNSAR